MLLSERGNHLRNIFWIILLVFIFSPLLKNIFKDSKGNFSKTQILMDTFVTINIYDSNMNKKLLNIYADSAFTFFKKTENYFDKYNLQSLQSIIEKNAGISPVKVPGDFAGILGVSRKYSEITNGFFDITIGPIVRLWDIPNKKDIPLKKDLESLLNLVNYQDLEIDNQYVFLKKTGMQLDVGGVAKGYAVDEALGYLKSKGIRNIIVDAGGDLGVYITKSEKAKVKIAHPRKENTYWGSLFVKEKGIATSGDYQRYIVYEGKRYHHILNPETGYPSYNCVSVTIAAQNTTVADIISTAVFILGPEKGMNFINSHKEIEGIIIYEQNGELKSIESEGIGKFNYKKYAYNSEEIS